MISELHTHLAELEAAKARGRELVAGLSHAQLNWRQGPGRWSVAECLAHLNDSVTKVLPAIDRTIERARARGWRAGGPFRYGWFANWMVRSMEPPPRRRMRSPKIFRLPPAEYDGAELARDFAAVRDRLAARVRAAEGLDLKRAIVTSPASRFFRLPLGAYLAFLLAHERRHLEQASSTRRLGEAAGWRPGLAPAPGG